MRVSEWMSTDLVKVRASDLLDAAIIAMDRHAVRHVLVYDHERCVGVLSDRDLLEATGWSTLRARHAAPDQQYARDLMSTNLELIGRDEPLSDACWRMFERRIGCLPVVDERERVVGILSERDALRAHQHLRRSVGDDVLLDPTLTHVMSRELVTLDVSTSVREAYARSRELGLRHLFVGAEGWLVGMVSDRDLRQCIGRGDAERRKLGDIMVNDPLSLAPDARLGAAVDLLVEYRFSSVPVLEARKLVGLVTIANVLARLARFLESRQAPGTSV
jgi:acetoin utilization protein AcuB